MYKHNNGELAEVTKEYKLHIIDPEEWFELGDHDIAIYDDMSRIIYRNPITGRQSTTALRSYPGEKSSRNWDWDLTDGKLSLQQSILGNPRNPGGPYHFYLRDNKFYPCRMRNYSEWEAKGLTGWDGKPVNDEEA